MQVLAATPVHLSMLKIVKTTAEQRPPHNWTENSLAHYWSSGYFMGQWYVVAVRQRPSVSVSTVLVATRKERMCLWPFG